MLIVQHNKSIVIPRDSRLDLYNMRLAHKSISNIIRCPLDIPARPGPYFDIFYFGTRRHGKSAYGMIRWILYAHVYIHMEKTKKNRINIIQGIPEI